MNLQEIIDAVDAGKTVYWVNAGYRVERNGAGPGLYIYCPSTGSVTPATTPTTKSPPIAPTLLYPESQFFLAPESEQPGEAEKGGSTPARFTHYFDVRCSNSFASDIADFEEAFDAWAESFSDRLTFRRELLSSTEGTKSLMQGVTWSDTVDHQDAQFAGEGEMNDFSASWLGL